jgi:tRNA(fMet)-specific endonuclease VapC
MFMLDTNICIYIIKKRPDNVLKKFSSLNLMDVCISSVTFAELMYGVEKSQYPHKNKTALEEFILPLEIMPFDDEAARYYGHLRAYLEKNGMPIGPMDLMIAAHAQSISAILVTNDEKEFKRISELKVENWVKGL